MHESIAFSFRVHFNCKRVTPPWGPWEVTPTLGGTPGGPPTPGVTLGALGALGGDPYPGEGPLKGAPGGPPPQRGTPPLGKGGGRLP